MKRFIYSLLENKEKANLVLAITYAATIAICLFFEYFCKGIDKTVPTAFWILATCAFMILYQPTKKD